MKATPILILLVFVSVAQAQQKMAQDDPSHGHCEMMKRGEKGMGFSQQTTTHHFRLLADGGVIEIGANDPKDTAGRDQIRQHLSHIAKMFSEGNFEIPMFIHDKTPPGVPTMRNFAIKFITTSSRWTREESPNSYERRAGRGGRA
jgi:hypothetical protein